MVLTGERRLGADIWLETSQQAESTGSIMRITWNTVTMQGQKASGKLNCLLALTNKEARHVRVLLFSDLCQQNC